MHRKAVLISPNLQTTRQPPQNAVNNAMTARYRKLDPLPGSRAALITAALACPPASDRPPGSVSPRKGPAQQYTRGRRPVAASANGASGRVCIGTPGGAGQGGLCRALLAGATGATSIRAAPLCGRDSITAPRGCRAIIRCPTLFRAGPLCGRRGGDSPAGCRCGRPGWSGACCFWANFVFCLVIETRGRRC